MLQIQSSELAIEDNWDLKTNVSSQSIFLSTRASRFLQKQSNVNVAKKHILLNIGAMQS